MSNLIQPVGPGDHVIGPTSARVTLVEYGDYECRESAKAQIVIEQLLSGFGECVRFVFRHFPVARSHPHAVAAAEAAEAAGVQDRFWPMHEMLFHNRDALALPNLLGYAKRLGLDVDRFAAELELGSHSTKVNGDFHSGLRSGVQTTPTFFVDGVKFEGPFDGPELKITLRQAATAPPSSAAMRAARPPVT
jgi:protein-disulfide isomerase